MAASPITQDPTFISLTKKLTTLLAKLIVGKMHGQLVINFRDGHVQNIETRTSFLPDKLPEN
jgi:hypothetical protein